MNVFRMLGLTVLIGAVCVNVLAGSPVPNISLSVQADQSSSVSPLHVTNGTIVTFTYSVTNTGDTVLSTLFIFDNTLGDFVASLDCPNILLPGSALTTTRQVVVTASLTNTIDALALAVDHLTCGPLVEYDPVTDTKDVVVIVDEWADELMTESLDADGRVSFSEISDATSYQIVWATNLAEQVWLTLSPPGVSGIMASGPGVRVVTTQLDHASSAFRIEVVTNEYMVVDLSDGPSATNYPVFLLADVPPGGWSNEYKSTKMVFRRIPAGTFIMGSPTNEVGRYSSDEVEHQVSISQPFYMGIFEVTQKQWEQVMGTWPSYFTNAAYRDARPVEQVSYDMIRGTMLGTNWPTSNGVDTNSFMGRLRSRTDWLFDLPTESQWEYAGRARTVTALNTGYNLTNATTDDRMSEVGRYWKNGGSSGQFNPGIDISGGTAMAGTYLPNMWGLYDIHGNVWEWCLDWYGTYPGTVIDPTGTSTGSVRLLRGGSWFYDAGWCRSAYRFSYSTPDAAYSELGFRVAAPVVPTEPCLCDAIVQPNPINGPQLTPLQFSFATNGDCPAFERVIIQVPGSNPFIFFDFLRADGTEVGNQWSITVPNFQYLGALGSYDVIITLTDASGSVPLLTCNSTITFGL